MINPEDIKPTAQYSIKEVCEIFNIHRTTLRRWTELGYIMVSYRNIVSKPYYTGKNILKAMNFKHSN